MGRCARGSSGGRVWIAGALAIAGCGARSAVLVVPDDGSVAADRATPGDRAPPGDRAAPPRDAPARDRWGADREWPPVCHEELCNGRDDDCDGLVDEAPEADASCDLPGSVARCQGGRCVASSCTAGFGDCDGLRENGCEPLVSAFPDADGDGHGDATAAPAAVCAGAAGYAAVADDCRDDSAEVYPGQTALFAQPRADGSFDFDCDGNETKAWGEVTDGAVYCMSGPYGASCGVNEGWLAAVPECGAAGTFVTGCTITPCAAITEQRVQRCR